MGVSFFMEYFPILLMLAFLARTSNGDVYLSGVGLGIVNFYE